MPIYPSTIPQPNASGFSLDPKKDKEEFQSEFGNKRQRRFVTSQVYVCSMRFDFKMKSEFDEFLKWFKYDIDYGNFWFEADFLLAEGFNAGEWVWRFAKINYNASGYSMGFSCTMLMSPKYTNYVSPNYVELGTDINGTQRFLNPFTDVVCSDFTYYRTFLYSYLGQQLQCLDYNGNGLNWTPIGNAFSLASPTAMTNTRSICAMKADSVALVNGVLACILRMFKFDGTNWTLLGSTTLATYSTLRTAICRLSDNRIALLDGGLKTLTVWDYDYVGNTWSQVGSSFNMSAFYTTAGRGAITALSGSRVAVVINQDDKLATFDFNGSTWSQNGSTFQIYPFTGTGSADYSISARTSSVIILTHNIRSGASHTYEKRYTEFTFSGGVWTAGTPSAQFTNGGFPVLCAMAVDKIASVRASSVTSNMTEIAVDITAGAFTDLGNTLDVSTGVNQDSFITSYFKPV
jgi:hypothetical protein